MLDEGLEKNMEAKWLFYAPRRICSLQDSPKQNSAPTNFTASMKISYLIL